MALIIALLGVGPVSAQSVTNTGPFYVSPGTTIFMGGDFTNSASGVTENRGSVELDGDWINHGSYLDIIGTVSLTGTNQLITGSVPTTFNNLNTLGTGVKTMTLNATVTDTLFLSDRELATDSNILFVTNTDTAAITRTTGFVSSLDSGSLSRATLSTKVYLFPVGSSIGTARYRPVEIAPTSAAAHTFGVRMGNVDPTTEGYDITNKQPGIGAINANWYHRIDRTAGTAAADITIFKDILELGTEMVHWEVNWEDIGPVTSTTTSVTRLAWNDFSPNPFALAEEILVVNAGNDTTVCSGVAVQLQATVTGGIGPYSYAWTPSTYSNDSNLANPLASNIAASITYTMTVYDSGTSSSSLPDTIVVTVNPSYTVTPPPTSICQGDSILLPGGGYASTAGAYSDTLTTTAGCDSVIQTTVVVNSTYLVPVAAAICQGDSVLLAGGTYATSAGTYNDTLNTTAGCDSVIQTTVSVNSTYLVPAAATFCQGDSILLPGGIYASTAGIYNDTLNTTAGCDSVIETTVAVNSTYLITVASSVCQGDSVLLPGGTYASTAGIYNDTLNTVAGCDSIIETTVAVNSTYLTPFTSSICQGDSILLPGGTYASTAGVYNDTLNTIAGCDSVIETTVAVNTAYLVPVSASICQGDSVLLPGGTYATAAGTFNDTLITIAGCDSVLTTTVTVNSVYSTLSTVSLCPGDSVLLPGGTYTSTVGTYNDTLTTIAGCDSVIETTVSASATYFIPLVATICLGDSILLPGGTYATTTGIYNDTLNSLAGCDSVIETTVTASTTYFIPLVATICLGDSLLLPGGTHATTPGIYSDTLSSLAGCDSVIETTVSASSTYFIPLVATICLGDSLLLPGGTYATTPGIYGDTLNSLAGCDSIIETTVSVTLTYLIPVAATICQGDSILLPGGSYASTGGTYSDTLTTISGCDSIIETTLGTQPAPTASITGDSSICIGTSTTLIASGGTTYQWNTGATSAAITVSPLTSLTYSVVVTDPSCSMSDSASVIVTVNNLPTITALPDLVTIVLGESVALSASGGAAYIWTPGADLDAPFGANPLASPTVTTLYYVSGTDINGCSATDSVLVTVSQDFAIGVPNIFSPNGDGQNDKLNVSEQGLDWMRLIIYDRWGEKVFESNDVNTSWDGTFNGNPMNPAVFVYYLQGAFVNGTDIKEQGNITLVR